MKIAYLIIAHKNPEQLCRLIRALTYKDNEFYIHIDKKSDIRLFLNSLSLLKERKIHLIKDRRVIRYSGGFGQTECIASSLLEIFSRDCDFDYLVFLSGQDYPIKNNEFIHEYFRKNKGKEFVELFPIESTKEAERRLSRYTEYFFDDFGPMGKFLNRVFRKLKIKKHFPLGYTPYYGSCYWRITRNCAKYLVEFITKNPKFVDFFRFSSCSDECVYHTIIWNSRFSTNTSNTSTTYIDWSTGFHPKVLNCNDFKKINQSNTLFARKFDIYTDSKILDLIDEKLLHKL